MMDSIGTRWQPGQDLQMQGGQHSPVAPSAQPAKLLSLRLPNRQGQSAVAPSQLLQGQGSQQMGGGQNLTQFLTLLSHLLNNPANAGGGYAGVPMGGGEYLGEDRDPRGETLRLNVPGLQVPAQGPTQRIQPSPTNIPAPRFTIGQGAGNGDLAESGAPPLF